MIPKLAITMGDINGVGPEIIAKAFADSTLREVCTPIVFGDADVYAHVQREIATAPKAYVIDTLEEADATPPDCLPVFEGGVDMASYAPGNLSAAAGRCAMQWFERAIEFTLAGLLDGIVTCPINKEGIHLAGYNFQGHTDFIAAKTDTHSYRMCLFTQTLRVIHLSEHLPLREALGLVTKDRIIETLRMTHDLLLRLDTPQRRIAVAGLNPHASEAGAFGDEEHDEIIPAIQSCQALGIDCTGPISPDAVFRQALDGKFEAVIALYHDQGHIPMKLVAMDEGVNVTLGIPIVRTSVDHGTAYDIAGQGIAREHSLQSAIRIAAQLVASRPGVTP